MQSTTLPGDILLICAFVSYGGCFTRRYRDSLMKEMLPVFLKSQKVKHDLV